MSENAVEQLKTVFGTMSLAKKISIALLLMTTISGFVFIMTWAGTPNYQTLYSGLSSEDAGSVIAYLQENNIPYKVSSYGNNILVPDEQVHETRMQLAAKGIPQGGGVGFEIFDNTKIGMTEFSQNINYQRALQGELSRTINRFDEVDNSRVHIVMASKSIFQENEEPATASVVIKLYPGRKLANNKVQAIVHLLSSAISGLQPENVTVVDNNGNMLTRINNGDLETSTDDQMSYQSKLENNLENRVKSMLETALGKAKATVRVSCAMDFQKMEKTQEMYLPENRVIRSEQHFNELSNDQNIIPAGIPGIVKNDGVNEEINANDVGATGYRKNDQTINYEIGKVVSHIVEPTGKLTRLSIAVIVDGTYREKEDEEGNISREYIPRTPEEMAKLKGIVKTAVNFDENRGDILEVVNMPFEAARAEFALESGEKQGWVSKIMMYSSYMKYLFAIIMIFMTFTFVIRPIVSWLTNLNTDGRDLIDELPKTLNEIENGTPSSAKQISFHDKASEAISQDQSSVDLLREWLAQS